MKDKITITEARRRVDERYMLGEISKAEADRRHQELNRLRSTDRHQLLRLAATTANA